MFLVMEKRHFIKYYNTMSHFMTPFLLLSSLTMSCQLLITKDRTFMHLLDVDVVLQRHHLWFWSEVIFVFNVFHH